MLASWTIEHQGQTHEVTVTRMPNGKDVIRVNGRVVAKPLDASEFERTIALGHRHYNVSREADGTYALTPLGTEYDVTLAAHELTPTASRESLRIVPLVYAAVVILLGGSLWWGIASSTSYRKLAAKRVNQILNEAKQGTGPEAELAVTLWAKNRRTLDRDELSWASNHFDQWRMDKGLYRKFGEHTIVDSEEVKGADVPTAIVSVTIEGKPYRMRVPKDQPISWE